MIENPPGAPSVVKPSSNVPNLVAVVIVTLATIVAMVVIELMRPGRDNTTILTMVAAQAVPTTGAILAYMKSQETHLAVNSRLEQFNAAMTRLANTQSALANREGVLEGVAQEQARTHTLPPVVVPAAVEAVPPLPAKLYIAKAETTLKKADV